MAPNLALCVEGPYKALPAMSGFPSGADRVASLPPSPSPEGVDATTELLQGCIRGDVDARRRLVAEYSGIVSYGVSVIFQQFGRPSRREEIEDICQDVFLALFDQDARKLRQYQGRNGCSLASWLRVVANRLTIDRLRREGRTVSLDDPNNIESWRVREVQPDAKPGPEPQVEEAQRAARVRELIAQLPPKDQLFVQLFYFQGLPIEEVANTIGITTNAAYVRKMRLHEKLRRLVAERFEGRL
ncbi:MAG: sigma-70 family RNA polymerase sigma factor [Thermodesulfobacteriota bacterium]